MHKEDLFRQLAESPVIAAVKSKDQLGRALQSDCAAVFVLAGDIINIGGIVAQIKDAGKIAFVHVDLIYGLAAKEVAIEFISKNTRADGIISTKPPLIRPAKSRGLLTVQRFFLLDSIALENTQKQMEQDCADLIEVLPGVMPKILRKIVAAAHKPVIAGGLIVDKEDVMGALGAGASAVSSTNPEVWFL